MNLRKRLVVAVSVVGLSTAAGALTKEQLRLFFGKDERVVAPLDRSPWQAVGQLTTASGQRCTGTLVAPTTVLTAGHCFINRKGQLDRTASFTLGLVGAQFKYRVAASQLYVPRQLLTSIVRRVNGIVVPPAVARYDFAFIRLSHAIGNGHHYLPVFSGSASELAALLQQLNHQVTQGGYPQDHRNIMMMHHPCVATTLDSLGRLAHRCNTLPGDSGSPILVNVDGRPIIIGIQSSAPSAPHRHQADNMAISAPVFRALLQRFVAEPRSLLR